MNPKRTPPRRSATPGVWVAVALGAFLCPPAPAQGGRCEKDQGAPQPTAEEALPDPSEATTPDKAQAIVKTVLAAGRKDADAKIQNDPALRTLAAKYPLVVLHSRRYAVEGGYMASAYSFILETSDPDKHRNRAQILFDNGSGDRTFHMPGETALIADLGEVDFTVNPNPKDVDIDGDGQNTWLAEGCQAIEGHVYLERVRDMVGNKFYVLLKVVGVEKDSKYVAFLWRILPGGKIVKPK